MAGLDQLIDDICTAIEASSIPFNSSREQHGICDIDQPQMRAALNASADGIKTSVAKCAIMWQEIQKDAKLAGDLFKGILSHVSALCALCLSLHEHGGPSLSSQTARAAKLMVSACSQYVRSFKGQPCTEENVKHLAGVIFQQCENVRKHATDNKTAIGRKLVQVAVSIKDASREFQELSQELRGDETDQVTDSVSTLSLAADGPDAEAGPALRQDEQDVEEDIGFHAQNATKAEMDVVSIAVELATQLSALMTAVLRSLQKCVPRLPDTVQQWEAVLEDASAMEVDVTDLGAGLYPPQEREELAGVLKGLQQSLKSLTSSCSDLAVSCNDVKLTETLHRLEASIDMLDT